MHQVAQKRIEEVYYMQRQNKLNFLFDTINLLKDGANINDCTCNQMIYQGAECSLCPLVHPSLLYCYREVGFWLK